MPDSPRPQLVLSHATVAVRSLEAMVDFYCEVLDFAVTDRGELGDGSRMAFVSQDPGEHHQLVFVSGLPETEHQFVMADHMAFRTPSLDSLRAIAARLAAADVDGVIPVNHGNAWSLYFNDPEGNGLECFVDSPFHVAQPFADALDLSLDDATIEAETRAKVENDDEFQPMAEWRAAFRARLAADRAEG
ncbi:MAG: VOC family protein [Actinomycetota bacterium]